MRTPFPKIFSGLLLAVVLMSCEDDADKVVSDQRAVIQFQHEQQTLREDDPEGVTVSLTLNRATAAAGTIRLTIPENMRQRLQTNPAHTNGVMSLPVAKGVNQLQFSVRPVNNTLNEGDQTIMISIEESTGFILGDQKSFQLIIEEDDSNEDPDPVQSTASFMEQSETVSENQGEPVAYKILLTPAVVINSKVIVAIATDHANAFVTEPLSEDNSITLSAPAGATELSFTLNAIDNAEFTGEKEIEFTIVSTEGSVIKGSRLVQKVTISDDELSGKLKGYEINGSEGSEKRAYEYDSQGRIAKVIRETNAPHNSITTTDTYFYDNQSRLVKINKHLGRDIHYLWNNNRIERAEVYQDGELIQYANYAYDDQGNVGGVEPFYKQRDGSFSRGLFSVHLYFTDGNIYKTLVYNDVPGSEEPVLIVTRTYDAYLDVTAPVAMLEILPTVMPQKNLAGTYRLEEHQINKDITYSLTYEFRPDGQPSKRIASAPGETQTVLYHYY